MTKIAFIGLGNMGAPMAANLIKAGHAVLGHDLSEESRRLAEARGIVLGQDLAATLDQADTVITMLPSGKHVRAVWTDLVALAPKGTLLIDCSTIDVESARIVHNLALEHGLLSIDAPVSGGTGGAESATLTFMMGGEQPARLRAEPILGAMGRKIVPCGGPGAGQAAKICNNMILGISMIGVSEAFVLGEKLGLSHQALFDVVSTSSGQCWSVTTYCPVPGPVPASPANHGYRPGFAAKLMLKDLTLAAEAASQSKAATPMGALAAELFARFSDGQHDDEDFSGIIRMIRAAAAAT
jgi:3-hydroxyisobutyrate dehydrogenase